MNHPAFQYYAPLVLPQKRMLSNGVCVPFTPVTIVRHLCNGNNCRMLPNGRCIPFSTPSPISHLPVLPILLGHKSRIPLSHSSSPRE